MLLPKPSFLGLLLIASLGLATGAVADSPAEASHYPYDPVCSWGRLADGRGMLVRCLTESEAVALATATPAPSSSTVPGPAAASVARPPEPDPSVIDVEVGPVTVESGRLPEALRKLRAARDRFRSCVGYQGALTAPRAEISVRFLVRERGRAEGVHVTSRRGLSDRAARCVADVIDRRSVGVPDQPMVAATAVIRFRRAE